MAYKKLTSHGSISIPVAMRRELGLEPRDPMEVEEKDGKIILAPYQPRCVFCKGTEGVEFFEGKGIPVFNNSMTCLAANDKYATYEL